MLSAGEVRMREGPYGRGSDVLLGFIQTIQFPVFRLVRAGGTVWGACGFGLIRQCELAP